MKHAAPPIERLPLWVIILTCATIAAIGMGVRQAMGLYVKPLSDDLGLGLEAFSMAVAYKSNCLLFVKTSDNWKLAFFK